LVGEDFGGEHEAAGPNDGPVWEIVVGFVALFHDGVIEEGVRIGGGKEVDGAQWGAVGVFDFEAVDSRGEAGGERRGVSHVRPALRWVGWWDAGLKDG